MGATDAPTLPESPANPVEHKKRRLRRNCSDWDKTLNLKVRQNANRDDLIRVTKSIIAYIVDNINKDEDTISGIIDDCVRLGREWMKFPKSMAAVESMPFGKLTYLCGSAIHPHAIRPNLKILNFPLQLFQLYTPRIFLTR